MFFVLQSFFFQNIMISHIALRSQKIIHQHQRSGVYCHIIKCILLIYENYFGMREQGDKRKYFHQPHVPN